MKKLHILRFNSNNQIFKIVDRIEETEGGLITTKIVECREGDPNQIKDEDGITCIESGIIETPIAERNFTMVCIDYDEVADKIVSYMDGKKTIAYELKMTPEIWFKVNNNSAFWIDNKLTIN